ncbi:DNA cytosine methyltransferase, partial [uncultured Duncaniella sp.]
PDIERFPLSAVQGSKAIRDCALKTDSTVIISGAIVSPQFGGGFRPVLSGKAPCLLATSSNSAACLIVNGDDIVLRRLTPKECCRLQTIPDWYEWVCSEPQIYKMLGNGWTVDVIRHILQFL